MKPQVADYHYRALCLRIVPANGATIRLTHHPRNLTMSNGEVYLTGAGHDFTGYSATASLSAAVVDLSGIADQVGIGANELASGYFDGARCYLFATEWHTPVEDYEPIVASILGKTTLLDERYVIEEMALIDALNQSVGKTYTVTCPKTFGGQEYAGCMVDLSLITVTGTLTAVTSSSIFRDSARGEAADWFAAGTIQFTSGANAGLKKQEVKIYAADGTIEAWEPFHYTPVIGDAYTLIPGCRKRLIDCRDKWSNVINFGGFSNIPTSRQYTQHGTGSGGVV